MLNLLRAGVALSLSALLAACGGGDPTPESSAVAAFSAPLRAPDRALCDGRHDTATVRYVLVDGVCTATFAPMPAGILAPADASASAAQPQRAPLRSPHRPFSWPDFHAWAEANFPQFFRGSVQAGTVADYAYRYYPATGHYLALKGEDGLFAMGPATGHQILFVGTLWQLECFVYAGNCALGGSDVMRGVSTTATLTAAGTRSAISVWGDEDWFAVDLIGGHEYTFTMEGSSTGQGTLPGAFLYVVDASMNLVARDTSPNQLSVQNSRAVFTPSASGRYFVAATSVSGTGTYRLSMSGGPTSLSGATQLADMARLMGTTAYGTTVSGYTVYVQLNAAGTEVTEFVCSGTPLTCFRTTSASSSESGMDFLSRLRLNLATNTVTLTDAGATLQPTTAAPATFGTTAVDTRWCSIYAGTMACPRPRVTVTGTWTGTWNWTGLSELTGCTHTNRGAFTMTVTQGDTAEFTGTATVAGLQQRSTRTCEVTGTQTLTVSVRGTKSGNWIQFSFSPGNSSYVVEGGFDPVRVDAEVRRTPTGGTGRIFLDKRS